MSRWKATVLVACAAGLAASSPAFARASDLSWSGPVECARSEQLLFQVERALGAPLAETGLVHLQVHVARVAPTARALLRIADDGAEPAISERRLVAPDCDKLVDTLAVAITLAIEAAAPQPETEPVPAASAEPQTPGQPLASMPAPRSSMGGHTGAALDSPRPDSSPSAGPRPRVTARLLGDIGSLPGPALGVGVGAQLAWTAWLLELTGALWGERHARLDSTTAPGMGADLSLATATLAGCALPADGDSVAIALCAGWEMGRVSGVGTGVTSPRRAGGLWLAPSIEAGLTWKPSGSRIGIGARLGAAAPLTQRSFYLERLGTVHEVSSLVARAGLSLDVALE